MMLSQIAERQRDGTFVAPSVLPPFVDRLRRNTVNHSPFRLGSCFAVQSYHAISAGIASLLKLGGPVHVAGLVVSSVVDAVKGVSRCRSATDYGQEVFVGVESELDSSAAVVVEGVVGRVGAAALGAYIAVVFRAVTTFTVRCSAIFRSLRVQASAGLCVSGSEALASDGHLVTAGADAVPFGQAHRFVGACSGEVDDGESAERSTCQVLESPVLRLVSFDERVEDFGPHPNSILVLIHG